ncbi:MAG: response regulator, partial [Verrucomicrobiia bacterium]
LAICKRLSELMGGSIRVESRLGEGSTFIFTVRMGVARRVEPGPGSGGGEVATGRASMSVLAAEDNPINRRLLEQFLAKAGCQARIVGSGAALMEALVEGAQPDLILMDVHMPDMDGLEATRRVRRWEAEQDPLRRTPILAFTASAMEDERAECEAAGMDGFLTKPLRLEGLLEALRKVGFR